MVTETLLHEVGADHTIDIAAPTAVIPASKTRRYGKAA